MTVQDIKTYAESLGYSFSDEDAQDVIDSRPSWFTGQETVEQAVQDYLDAFGG
jgi:hypothetical protein